jgi:pimeloyl-ACP methyl ester carboxylesterase
MSSMAANSATKTRATKASTSSRSARKDSAPRVEKPETLEHLLQTYRDAPEQVGENGHAPLQEYEGKFVEAGQRMVFLRSTPNAGQAGVRQAVFVHGLGGSARNWTDLMYLLSPVVGGIAPDLPGFGRSPFPKDRDYSQGAHAQAVIRLIEDRCDGPIDLFGNSMGGAISVRIAALRPDLVRSLVLVAPALPDFRPRLSVAPLIAMTAPVLADITAKVIKTDDAEATVDRMHNLCFLDTARVHPERREIQIEETRWRMARENAGDPLRMSARGLGQAFIPGRSDYLWSLAEQVECPTLAIFGSHDKLVDPRLATRAARSFSNGRVTTLKTGHVAQMEHPVKVAQLVLQMWVESHI